jgi:hypothetical protein
MKHFYILTLLFLAVNSFGQSVRIRLSNTSIENKELPKDFTNRVFWNQTDLFKYNLDQLTGSIIYTDPSTGNFERATRVVDAKSQLQIKSIEKGLLYHSKIDNRFNADLKLFILSAEMANEQVIDITISDILAVFINHDKIPMEEVLKASKNIKTSGKVYYIQGALLTSIEKKYNSKISSEGSITGTVFATNGSLYNEDIATSSDFRISLTLLDLSQISFFKGSKNLENADDLKDIVQSSTVKKPLLIKINNTDF